MKFFKPLPATIYVDLDGVMAAWTETVYAHFGKVMPEGDIAYDVHHDLGLDEADMWDVLNALGPAWWAELPPYPWMRGLWSGLSDLGTDIAVLTSPCTVGNSAMGKTQWIRRHIGADFRAYVMTADKWRLAHPRAVLVDDSDEKLRKFSEHGGLSVVFPRQWNSGGARKPDLVVDEVVSNVRAALLQAGVDV